MTISSKQKIITLAIAAIMFFLMMILSSCSASWHLRTAIRKGANVRSDTVYIQKVVTIPEVKTDTIFKSQLGDTVYITKDRLKIKYVNLPGDSVFIEGECESDTVVIQVPVIVNNDITAPPTKSKWWLWLLIGALVASLILFKLK